MACSIEPSDSANTWNGRTCCHSHQRSGVAAGGGGSGQNASGSRCTPWPPQCLSNSTPSSQCGSASIVAGAIENSPYRYGTAGGAGTSTPRTLVMVMACPLDRPSARHAARPPPPQRAAPWPCAAAAVRPAASAQSPFGVRPRSNPPTAGAQPRCDVSSRTRQCRQPGPSSTTPSQGPNVVRWSPAPVPHRRPCR